jgi:hypothetical protein
MPQAGARHDVAPRFRCVICWRLRGWGVGCCDDLERAINQALSRRAFIDLDHEADAGICDDCWFHLGGEAARVEVVHAEGER